MLSIEQGKLDGHIIETYSDANREVPTELVPDLFKPCFSQTAFDNSPVTWKKWNVYESRLEGGPNDLTYSVYNMYPGLLMGLWSLLVKF